MMFGLSLSLLILAFTVSISEANYNFTIHFYEFRNPLGLQCGKCENDGAPACCDDVQRNESCMNERPHTCDTRFRFLLRQFGESVDSAPNKSFPHYTSSHGGNSHTFNEGPGGLLSLPNPFTITSSSPWNGMIQFFIDALDRAVSRSSLNETEAIINRFPIDLKLELGADFAERMNYTGIYNISGLGFDMSFRVQCSENYYGPDCTTYCEPKEGAYTCDSKGKPICLQDNRSFCPQCISGWNPSPQCAVCLDPSTNCTACRNRNFDPSTNCTKCIAGHFLDPQTDCTKCMLHGYDPASNCTTTVEITDHVDDHTDGGLGLVVGVAGGGFAALVLIIVLILCIIIVVFLKKKKTTYDMSDTASVSNLSMYTKKTDSGCSSAVQHDFKNPLYGPGKAPATAHTTNDEKYPLEQLVEVPNPFYGEFPDSASQTASKRGSLTSQEDDTPRSRLDTFPYIMDGENITSNSSHTTPLHQQRERVKHVVYEMADIDVRGKPTTSGMYETADKVCGKPAGVENGMYETADKVRGKPMGAEAGMYDTADNVCGKSAGIEEIRYKTADNVCGKPARAEGGKKESGVVIQGEEYDDIMTSGAAANVYDDIVSGKKSTDATTLDVYDDIVSGKNSADAKVSSDISAMYDDVQTSNTSAFCDVLKVDAAPPLYDDVTTSKSLPSATDNYEYDDIKGPGEASSEAAAKPNSHDAITYSVQGEQPFDNEVYNAPFSPPNSQALGTSFINDSFM